MQNLLDDILCENMHKYLIVIQYVFGNKRMNAGQKANESRRSI